MYGRVGYVASYEGNFHGNLRSEEMYHRTDGNLASEEKHPTQKNSMRILRRIVLRCDVSEGKYAITTMESSTKRSSTSRNIRRKNCAT